MQTKTVRFQNPSTYSVNGVHHGYRTATAAPQDTDHPDAIKVWWGCLDPGGFIVPHIDAGPYHRRWHYPTEPGGYVWNNGVTVESPTEPFEITHWEPHAVWNPGPTRRVHLIVETSEKVEGESGLVMCDMLPEIQELIDAL